MESGCYNATEFYNAAYMLSVILLLLLSVGTAGLSIEHQLPSQFGEQVLCVDPELTQGASPRVSSSVSNLVKESCQTNGRMELVVQLNAAGDITKLTGVHTLGYSERLNRVFVVVSARQLSELIQNPVVKWVDTPTSAIDSIADS